MKEEKGKVVAAPVVKAADKEPEKPIVTKEPEKTVEKAEPITAMSKEEKVKPSEKKLTEKSSSKKASAKKTQAKKTPIKENIHLEFAGKSYSKEDLIKSVKDIWKYDHKKKAIELNSIDLYVKPEEGRAYYVINGEVLGDFIV